MEAACSAAATTTSGTPCPRHATMAPPEQASRMRRPSVVVSHTPSPRSTFAYGRSRKRGNTLVSSDRTAPSIVVSSAEGRPRTARVESRDIAEEPLQEPQRHPLAVHGTSLRLLEQGVRIHAVRVELVAVLAHPVGHDVGRDLGMELQPEAPTHHEGLRANVRLGHQG